MLTLILSMLLRVYQLILGVGTPNKFPPPLSPAEERESFALAAAGDSAAREKLILHNLRLVSHIVRKYYFSSGESEDLVSIGTIGLVKAVDSFRPGNGTHFATYAARCIQNEILMHFRARRRRGSEVSLSEAIDVDRDGNPLTYMDVLCTDEDYGEDVDRRELVRRAMRLLGSALGERERQIIVMRYGLFGLGRTYTQKEIAQMLKISRSYVSRIEKSALEKLRRALGDSDA